MKPVESPKFSITKDKVPTKRTGEIFNVWWPNGSRKSNQDRGVNINVIPNRILI